MVISEYSLCVSTSYVSRLMLYIGMLFNTETQSKLIMDIIGSWFMDQSQSWNMNKKQKKTKLMFRCPECRSSLVDVYFFMKERVPFICCEMCFGGVRARDRARIPLITY